jgi:hypothetical protein
MDEHAKSVMREPARVAFSVLAHFQLLFVVCPIVPKQKNAFSQYACLRNFQAFIHKNMAVFKKKKQHRR